MATVSLITPKMMGERLDLPHTEIIRRIRRGDIEAEKLGWNWVIKESEVEKALKSDWYKRVRRTTVTS
jgi:hypothetical protein